MGFKGGTPLSTLLVVAWTALLQGQEHFLKIFYVINFFADFKNDIEFLNLKLEYDMYMWKNTVSGVECTETDVEKHLEMGKKSLQAGQFADALSHYHAAVGKL